MDRVIMANVKTYFGRATVYFVSNYFSKDHFIIGSLNRFPSRTGINTTSPKGLHSTSLAWIKGKTATKIYADFKFTAFLRLSPVNRFFKYVHFQNIIQNNIIS